jgi:hypothetical protein
MSLSAITLLLAKLTTELRSPHTRLRQDAI